jgi:hypothetical protein
MPANRKEPESAPFWFQSIRSPAWRLYALGCSYSAPVGAGHAREQKGAGIGAFLVPEHKVASKARSYRRPFGTL